MPGTENVIVGMGGSFLGPQESFDGAGGFGDLRFERLVATGGRAGDAVTEMVPEQQHGDALERAGHGGDLGEHVDAVRVVVDHALQSPDLTFDAAQARQHGRSVFGVPRVFHAVERTPYP